MKTVSRLLIAFALSVGSSLPAHAFSLDLETILSFVESNRENRRALGWGALTASLTQESITEIFRNPKAFQRLENAALLELSPPSIEFLLMEYKLQPTHAQETFQREIKEFLGSSQPKIEPSPALLLSYLSQKSRSFMKGIPEFRNVHSYSNSTRRRLSRLLKESDYSLKKTFALMVAYDFDLFELKKKKEEVSEETCSLLEESSVLWQGLQQCSEERKTPLEKKIATSCGRKLRRLIQSGCTTEHLNLYHESFGDILSALAEAVPSAGTLISRGPDPVNDFYAEGWTFAGSSDNPYFPHEQHSISTSAPQFPRIDSGELQKSAKTRSWAFLFDLNEWIPGDWRCAPGSALAVGFCYHPVFSYFSEQKLFGMRTERIGTEYKAWHQWSGHMNTRMKIDRTLSPDSSTNWIAVRMKHDGPRASYIQHLNFMDPITDHELASQEEISVRAVIPGTDVRFQLESEGKQTDPNAPHPSQLKALTHGTLSSFDGAEIVEFSSQNTKFAEPIDLLHLEQRSTAYSQLLAYVASAQKELSKGGSMVAHTGRPEVDANSALGQIRRLLHVALDSSGGNLSQMASDRVAFLKIAIPSMSYRVFQEYSYELEQQISRTEITLEKASLIKMYLESQATDLLAERDILKIKSMKIPELSHLVKEEARLSDRELRIAFSGALEAAREMIEELTEKRLETCEVLKRLQAPNFVREFLPDFGSNLEVLESCVQ